MRFADVWASRLCIACSIKAHSPHVYAHATQHCGLSDVARSVGAGATMSGRMSSDGWESQAQLVLGKGFERFVLVERHLVSFLGAVIDVHDGPARALLEFGTRSADGDLYAIVWSELYLRARRYAFCLNQTICSPDATTACLRYDTSGKSFYAFDGGSSLDTRCRGISI